MSIPEDARKRVLVDCGRCCCICRQFLPTLIQIHHITPESQGGTDELDNLMPVCLICHSNIHTSRPFSCRFKADELKEHRDRLFRQISEGKVPIRSLEQQIPNLHEHTKHLPEFDRDLIRVASVLRSLFIRKMRRSTLQDLMGYGANRNILRHLESEKCIAFEDCYEPVRASVIIQPTIFEWQYNPLPE